MHTLHKILLTLSSCSLLAIASQPTIAQTNPPQSPTAEELGEFIGSELCSRYVTTGTFPNESAFSEMAVKLIQTYGEGAGLMILELAMKFSLPPDEMLADPHLFSLLQAALGYVIEDEACFRLFLANEVFGKKNDTMGRPQAEPDKTPPATSPNLLGQ